MFGERCRGIAGYAVALCAVSVLSGCETAPTIESDAASLEVGDPPTTDSGARDSGAAEPTPPPPSSTPSRRRDTSMPMEKVSGEDEPPDESVEQDGGDAEPQGDERPDAGPGCNETQRECAGTCIEASGCCSDTDCADNATCNGGACQCKDAHKPCGEACIPEDACCGDGDCPAGRRCNTGMCQTWCGQQERSSTVLEADYQCLDFDSALPDAGVWSSSTEKSFTQSSSFSTNPTQERAASAPSSMLADGATLTWSALGATPISRITLAAEVNPTAVPALLPPGEVASLVCAESGYVRICLEYVVQGDLYDFEETFPDYTGFYATIFAFQGAAIRIDCPLRDLSLTPNIWNSLVVDFDRTNSTLEVTIDERSASCQTTLGIDTNAKIGFGAESSFAWKMHYDNVEVSLERE